MGMMGMTGMTDRKDNKRRRAWLRGMAAESLAAWVLRFKGYRILARRLRTPAGEIDIVARRARLIAFVEVKARADYRDAVESVTPRQQRRIQQAAQFYLAGQPALAGFDQWFDVMIIRPGHLPTHLIDAWRPAS